MSTPYATLLLAEQRTSEAIARAERSRLARLATCCRPSAFAARAGELRDRLASALHRRSGQTCCA